MRRTLSRKTGTSDDVGGSGDAALQKLKAMQCLERSLANGGDAAGVESALAMAPLESWMALEMAIQQRASDACISVIVDRAGGGECGRGEVAALLAKKDAQERQALHLAVRKCSVATVQLLIARGADVAAQDVYGNTPLHRVARMRGGTQSVHGVALALLDAGADGNATDASGATALHGCTSPAIASELLLPHRGGNVNATDNCWRTPLQYCAYVRKNSTNTTSSLASPTTPVDDSDAIIGVAQVLLESGANVMQQDVDGDTVLHHSARRGASSLMEAVFAHCDEGAREELANMVNNKGESALHVAAAHGSRACVDILIQHGHKLARPLDNIGWRPIAHAVYHGHLPLATYLSVVADTPLPEVQEQQEEQRVSCTKPIFTTGGSPSVVLASETTTGSATVSFRVSASLASFQHIFIVGSTAELGLWDPCKSVQMTKSDTENVWQVSVTAAKGTTIQYKYMVRGNGASSNGRVFRWETLPQNRQITVSTDAAVVEVDDGAFEIASPTITSTGCVDGPWLHNQWHVRLQFGLNGAAVCVDSRKRSKACILRIKASNGFKRQVAVDPKTTTLSTLVDNFGCMEHVEIDGENLSTIAPLILDVHAVGSEIFLGSAVLLESHLNSMHGPCELPVIEGHRMVGSLSVHFVVVKPYGESELNQVGPVRHEFWDSMHIIGHRGSGSEKAARVVLEDQSVRRRTHVHENTVLSFVNAKKMGAELVEFDVQLSRDGIPVVYHDFVDQENHIAISHMPLSAFLSATARERNATRDDGHIGFRRSSSGHDGAGHGASSDGIPDSYSTLEQVCDLVPEDIGFNVEIKFVNIHEKKALGLAHLERNELVDRTLDVLFHSKMANRNIYFSSFDPDVCLMLRLKQAKYPVFLLSEAGRKTEDDVRKNSLAACVNFARSVNLRGIVPHCDALLLAPEVVATIRETGLSVVTWGAPNNNPANILTQLRAGVTCFILDHVKHVTTALGLHNNNNNNNNNNNAVTVRLQQQQ